MPIHRLYNRHFFLRNTVRAVVFLCFILLMSGCGGEGSIDKPIVESDGDENPIINAPITTPYYPMTLGSRWVYRNSDGSVWSREVVQSELILHDYYHSFTYDPPLGDRHREFIKSPTYVVASDGILLQTKLIDINDAIWQTVLRSNGDSSDWGFSRRCGGGVCTTRKNLKDALLHMRLYKIKVTKYSDFTLLHLAPDYPQRSNVFQMTMSGKHHNDLTGYEHDFESKVSIWAYTSFEPVVTTPVGRFENCLKIVYGTETTPIETLMFETFGGWPIAGLQVHLEHEINKELVVLVRMLKYNLKLQTMWLAPGVGPVKIETLDGYAELIDFDIK